MDQLSLHLLPLLHQLQQRDGPVQIPPEFQHFLVGRFVVLAVLSSLHLLGAPPERQVRVVGGGARPLLRLDGEDQRVLGFQPFVQPVIEYCDYEIVILLQQGVGLVQVHDGLTAALLQPVHHLLELERSQVQPLRLRLQPAFVFGVHVVVGDVLFHRESYKQKTLRDYEMVAECGTRRRDGR